MNQIINLIIELIEWIARSGALTNSFVFWHEPKRSHSFEEWLGE